MCTRIARGLVVLKMSRVVSGKTFATLQQQQSSKKTESTTRARDGHNCCCCCGVGERHDSSGMPWYPTLYIRQISNRWLSITLPLPVPMGAVFARTFRFVSYMYRPTLNKKLDFPFAQANFFDGNVRAVVSLILNQNDPYI